MAPPHSPPLASRTLGVVRILVVDDHPLYRKGLVEVLADASGMTVCAEAATVTTALASAASHRPDVAIIDLTLGNESGLDLVTALAAAHPDVRMLVVSGHDERVHANRALKAGALGYIMKDRGAADLLHAVRRVASGKPYVSEQVADGILTGLGESRHKSVDPLDRLSDRERQVLKLMGRGLSTREIAEQLTLSVKTVETYYANMKDKLGIRHGRELMRVAVAWSESNTI